MLFKTVTDYMKCECKLKGDLALITTHRQGISNYTKCQKSAPLCTLKTAEVSFYEVCIKEKGSTDFPMCLKIYLITG